MTYREKYYQCKTWQDKVVIINLFHCLKIATEKHWSIRLTAKYFSKSIGSVSEDIRLANNIDFVRKFPLRKDALAIIK